MNAALAIVTTVFLCFASAGWAVTPVLTYNGTAGGDWFASGVWLDEAGVPTNWQDGSVAVITNLNVALTANVVVYGFRSHMTSVHYISGIGKLTIGAGGIYKTGTGEFNIGCAGGLHLSDSQAWTAPSGGLVCIDGLKPLTAAGGVVLTGDGSTVLRMNAGGGLGSNTTILVTESASFSLSAGGSMGSSAIILDGVGNRLTADGGYIFADARFGSQLTLRNGASMACTANTFSLEAITVDAPLTQAVSSVTGTSLTFTKTNTTFEVSNGATLQISLPLLNGSGITAAVRKIGNGVLLLNAANTFSGGLAVDEGLARATAAGGLGVAAIAVTAPAVLELAASDTVTNPILGTGRVVKSGSGTLILPVVNSYQGGTTLSGGVTRAASPASLGSGIATLANNATLVFISTQTVSVPDVARIVGSGTVLAGAGAEVVWSGDYAVSGSLVLNAEAGGTLAVGQLIGSGFTKTLDGKLRIAGTTGYTGEIVVSAGVLEIGSTANLASGVTVRTTGSGIVQLDTLDGQDMSKITGTGMVSIKNGASIAINTDSLTNFVLTTVASETWAISNLTGVADLVKTGAGTLVVSNATAFTGRVRVLDGLLQSVGVLGNNTVTVSNGVFSAYGSVTVLQNTFTVAGGTLLADYGGSLGSGTIALLTGGTLAATNSGSLGSGTLAVNAGKLRIDVGGTAGTRTVTLSSVGRIEVYDGAGFNSATLTTGGGTLDFRATTTMGRGVTLSAASRYEANTPAGVAVPTVATLAGAITTTGAGKLVVAGNGQLRLAGGMVSSFNTEIFVQSSGDLIIVSNTVSISGYAGVESGGKRFAVADGGMFVMTGSGAGLNIGVGGAGLFEVMTGGVFTAGSGVTVQMGRSGGPGTFRMSGGQATVPNGSGQTQLGALSSSSVGILELNAGVLQSSRQLITNQGTGSIVFNGGTLQSDGVNSYDPWIATNIPVTIAASGGVIDTLGLDMKLGTAGISGGGTLTQMGGGLVRFSQVSTNWAGGLTLAAGTAVASATNVLGTGTVTLGTNTLRISGNALLPNTVVAPIKGGIVLVDAEVTGAVATVSGGELVKQGNGALFVDYMSDNSGFSIQGGQVAVTPLNGVLHAPAGVPAIWMDASVAASFVTATSNDVSRWYDRRTPGDATGFFATNLYNRPLIVTNALNGLPVLDFGRLGQTGQVNDNRLMGFKNYQTSIRTVFWVIGSKNGGGFLLGDSLVNGSMRHFHRSSGSGTYGGVPGDPLWGGTGQDKGIVRNGETWTNGVSVNGATTGLSGNYDLVTWRLSAVDDATNGTAGAVWFASCYASPDGRLNGGQELGEVLIYTNRLSDVEIKTIEHYLSRKWFPTRVGAGLALGAVSLDGAGAGFINAYTGPVQVAELTVNSTNVFVSGVAGGTAVSQVVVTASGLLGPSVTQALLARDLELKEQAALEAAFATNGALSVFALAGNLVLPAAARFMVTGGSTPPSSALLIDVSGSIQTPKGTTAWMNAGTESRASSVWVNAATKEVWLKTPRGTQILLR